MNDFAQRSGNLEQEHSSQAHSAPPNSRNDPNIHVVDYASQPGGTLLPMLISGIGLIVLCMIAVMIFF